MWTREQLKSNAKINFRRNYWPCVGVGFILTIITSGGAANSAKNGADYANSDAAFATGTAFVSSHSGIMTLLGALGITFGILMLLFSIFVGNVLEVGAKKFFVRNRTETPGMGTILDGFRGNYGNVVIVMVLKEIYIILWTCLLIIPGVIKAYEYLMVPYILAENPGMNRKEAFAISKRMMDGEKWNAFVLQLSFIGWYLLEGVTCGLAGIFYVTPYVEATMAELYAYNKGKAYEEGYIR